MISLLISGILSFGQVSLSSQKVMLLPASGDSVIAAAETNADGHFEFANLEKLTAGNYVLFCNVSTQQCVVTLCQTISYPAAGSIKMIVDTTSSDLVKVSGTLKSKDAYPSEFSIRIFPLHLYSLPEKFQHYVYIEGPGITRWSYETVITGKQFSLWVTKGNYRINGDYQPLNPTVDRSVLYFLTKAVSSQDCKSLKGDSKKGFMLEAKREENLVFELKQKKK